MKYLLFLLTLLLSSCSIVPNYQLVPNDGCKRETYHTICRGYEE